MSILVTHTKTMLWYHAVVNMLVNLLLPHNFSSLCTLLWALVLVSSSSQRKCLVAASSFGDYIEVTRNYLFQRHFGVFFSFQLIDDEITGKWLIMQSHFLFLSRFLVITFDSLFCLSMYLSTWRHGGAVVSTVTSQFESTIRTTAFLSGDCLGSPWVLQLPTTIQRHAVCGVRLTGVSNLALDKMSLLCVSPATVWWPVRLYPASLWCLTR